MERLFRRIKVKLRAARCWFSNDMKGQRVAHTTQVTCFENILRIRRFIYPNFSQPMCSWNDWSSPECSLVEWSHIPKCFFFNLEFRLNTEKKLCLHDPRNFSVLFNILRVVASNFKSSASSSWGYVSIENESKSTCIPTNESQVKELPCFDVMKGQRVAHTILTCFKDIFRIRRIFSANV